MLLDPLRDTARNITEIGVLLGHSLPMWLDYFSQAHIYAVDINQQALDAAHDYLTNSTGHSDAVMQRVHLMLGSSKYRSEMARLGIADGSMDVVIDDGDHSPAGQEKSLLTLWPAVRPGGYYIIEDIATGANRNTGLYSGPADRNDPSGSAGIVHRPDRLNSETRDIISQHYAIFVDTGFTVGHGSFKKWADTLRKPASKYQFAPVNRSDVVNHNSHLLVIRKLTASERASRRGANRDQRITTPSVQ